jgi:hypothetical protein
VISSTYVNHLDPVTGDVTNRIPAMTGYKGVANIMNTPTPAKNNGVVAHFSDSSVWTVTGTSYLTKMTFDETCSIRAQTGKNISMTVDGAPVLIAPGTYAGAIVIAVQ